jgi:Family of unknown function (DUF6789)
MRLRRVAKGLVAGAIATVPMTVVMENERRRGSVRTPAPEEITGRLLASTGTNATRTQRRGIAAVVHLATGAVIGALFAALPKPSRPLPRVALGASFGVSVYAINYFGVAPAARLMPAPAEDNPARQVATLVSHVVFGLTLAGLLRPQNYG